MLRFAEPWMAVVAIAPPGSQQVPPVLHAHLDLALGAAGIFGATPVALPAAPESGYRCSHEDGSSMETRPFPHSGYKLRPGFYLLSHLREGKSAPMFCKCFSGGVGLSWGLKDQPWVGSGLKRDRRSHLEKGLGKQRKERRFKKTCV